MSWISRDARNRAWRTFVSVGGAAGLTAAGTYIYGAVVEHRGFDLNWPEVLRWAFIVAVAPVLAYLRRRYGDPSPIIPLKPPVSQDSLAR